MLPRLGSTPASTPSPRLESGRATEDPKWVFGFRFFRQVDFFGLADAESQWFVSLLERLKQLSEESLSDFLCDGAKRDVWRYHPIDWAQKNIPLKRDDFFWIDSDYRDNEDEYPFVQFQISRSMGRVIGFFDDNKSFQIVLLDRMHNMQPSKSHGYRVDRTKILSCSYSYVRSQIEHVKKTSRCESESCGYKANINAIESVSISPFAVIVGLEDHDARAAQNAVSRWGFTHAEIYMVGLQCLQKIDDEDKGDGHCAALKA